MPPQSVFAIPPAYLSQPSLSLVRVSRGGIGGDLSLRDHPIGTNPTTEGGETFTCDLGVDGEKELGLGEHVTRVQQMTCRVILLLRAGTQPTPFVLLCMSELDVLSVSFCCCGTPASCALRTSPPRIDRG